MNTALLQRIQKVLEINCQDYSQEKLRAVASDYLRQVHNECYLLTCHYSADEDIGGTKVPRIYIASSLISEFERLLALPEIAVTELCALLVCFQGISCMHHQ